MDDWKKNPHLGDPGTLPDPAPDQSPAKPAWMSNPHLDGSAAQPAGDAPPPPPSQAAGQQPTGDAAASAVAGFGHGASFGLDDLADAAMSATPGLSNLNALAARHIGTFDPNPQGANWTDRFHDALTKIHAMRQADEAQHPVTSTTGQVAGNIAGTLVAPEAALAKMPLLAAGTGAVQGATDAWNGDTASLPDAGKAALMNAAINGGVPYVGTALHAAVDNPLARGVVKVAADTVPGYLLGPALGMPETMGAAAEWALNHVPGLNRPGKELANAVNWGLERGTAGLKAGTNFVGNTVPDWLTAQAEKALPKVDLDARRLQAILAPGAIEKFKDFAQTRPGIEYTDLIKPALQEGVASVADLAAQKERGYAYGGVVGDDAPQGPPGTPPPPFSGEQDGNAGFNDWVSATDPHLAALHLGNKVGGDLGQQVFQKLSAAASDSPGAYSNAMFVITSNPAIKAALNATSPADALPLPRTLSSPPVLQMAANAPPDFHHMLGNMRPLSPEPEDMKQQALFKLQALAGMPHNPGQIPAPLKP